MLVKRTDSFKISKLYYIKKKEFRAFLYRESFLAPCNSNNTLNSFQRIITETITY